MLPPLTNEELNSTHLPDPQDRNAVYAFAMTFNGYEHFGSFEAASANARARQRLTLVDLRNELFMQARGSNHRGDDYFLTCYRELLPKCKELLPNVHA
jgi:hypothetical protein